MKRLLKRLWNCKWHAYLGLAARFYLGWVFFSASLHKIAHPGSFALDIATYEMLPLGLVNLMAITLPWVEVAAGLMLMLGVRARAAALCCVGMMVIFIVALFSALSRGLDMSCGCFASQAVAEEDPISYLTVLRDLGWMAIAAYILFLDRRPLGLETLWQRFRRAK